MDRDEREARDYLKIIRSELGASAAGQRALAVLDSLAGTPFPEGMYFDEDESLILSSQEREDGVVTSVALPAIFRWDRDTIFITDVRKAATQALDSILRIYPAKAEDDFTGIASDREGRPGIKNKCRFLEGGIQDPHVALEPAPIDGSGPREPILA